MVIAINSIEYKAKVKSEADEKTNLNDDINDEEKIKAKSAQDDESIIDTLIFWD